MSEHFLTREEIIEFFNQNINQERVFFEIDSHFFAKARPARCNQADLEEFKVYSDLLKKYKYGYIIYRSHTHEEKDHLMHALDIELHKKGYVGLKAKGVLY